MVIRKHLSDATGGKRMAFCSQCGQPLADGAVFCGKCGQRQGQGGGPAFVTPVQPAANVYAAGYGYSKNSERPEFLAFAKKVQRRAWIFLVIVAVLALAAILIFVKKDLETIILVWAFVIVVTALINLFSGLAAKKSWEGQLIDKKIVIKRTRDQDSSQVQTRRIPTMYFQTTAGKKVKIEVGYQAGVYEYYEVGGHVRKHPRFRLPEKYEKGAEIICVYCGTIYGRDQDHCPKCKLLALK
jgi:hypothetical protein